MSGSGGRSRPYLEGRARMVRRNMRGGVSQEEPTSDVLHTVNELQDLLLFAPRLPKISG